MCSRCCESAAARGTLTTMFWITPTFAAGDPIVSVERGVFTAPFTVEPAASVEGEWVLCGTDTVAPSAACPASLEVTGTTTLRMQQVAPDGTTSQVVTHTYIFPTGVAASAAMDPSVAGDPVYGPIVVQTLSEMPSISVVVASTISTTEQAASAEWIDPAGDDLHVNCGVKLSGTTSLAYPKNSTRLYFRDEYGRGSVEFDFWGEDAPGVRPSLDQDALSLRSGHDSVFYLGAQGQYTRNFWMDQTQLDMGHLAPHGRFAHLYVNREYRGLYHVRERFNAAFMANYMGGDEDSYEAVNGGVISDGSGTAWAGVLAAGGDWEALSPWIDLPAFMDYMVLSFYAGNAWDWSYNHNWYAAGPSTPDEGGFRFESSDCDICVYYDYTVDITSNPGPSYVFYYLLQDAAPDFRVALADAIHRNLEAGGPLAADRAQARYAEIAAQAESAVVAESARWGGGWWTRDEEWVTERDRLLYAWFPYRTEEMLRQFRAVGWYPLPAPDFSISGGVVQANSAVTVSLPSATEGELWVTVDGSDPRVPGGEVAESADEGEGDVWLEHSTVLRARVRVAGEWGPLAEAFYEIDESSPVVLNEWNAVEQGETLDTRDFDGSGADDALGALAGNGGDWLELVVVEDTDMRGWVLSLTDLRGDRGNLMFSDALVLGSLRAGSILTIAEDLPEDAAYDPGAGDWRLHLRAGTGGSGAFISATPFDTSGNNFQVTLRDANGVLRFGPAGEGVSPRSGIGSHEVGVLAEAPSTSLRRTSQAWSASTRSTFGAANRWDGGEQDLSALRGESGGIFDLPGSGGADDDEHEEGVVLTANGCACSTGVPAGATWASAAWATIGALALARRKR